MKQFLLLFCLVFIFFNSVLAQVHTQTIRGKVVDKETEVPLAFANLALLNTSPLIGTSTDANGYFRLEKVLIGRYSIKITYMGYEEMVIQEVMVASGKEVVLNIELTEKIQQIKEVVIKAGEQTQAINSMAPVSARQLNISEASRYAGGFGDPSRMAASFAGASTADDENNEIVIRGNSPRGILWKLEGIEIPNPNHFSDGEGASGGGISILSNNVLANSDFFTGAFPAEYGNALSGAFDIHLRKGNTNKREYTFQLGVLGTELAVEGPFTKNYSGSYLAHYRYSTFDMLKKTGLVSISNEIVPVFQDLSFNINLPSKKAGTFSLFGVGGKSSAGQLAVHDSSEWIYRSDKFEETEEHQTGIIGISNLFMLKNAKTNIKTIVAYTNTSNTVINDSLDQNYNQVQTHSETFIHTAIRTALTLNHKFDSKNTIRSGISYHYLGFNLYDRGIDWDDNQTWKEFINQKGNTSQYQAFTQLKHRFTEELSITGGLHFLMLELNKNYSIEPRIAMNWNFNPRNTISIGAGLHSRIETITNYLIQIEDKKGNYYTPNINLDFSKAAHLVLGFESILSNVINFKAEAYYQYLYNVPVERDTSSALSAINANEGLATMPLSNKGTGYNYGIDLTLEKSFSKNYYFMITGSLFDSKYYGSDQVLRNTVYNWNYISNLLAGKEFKIGKRKNDVLGFNVKFIIRGGNRITPIDLEQSKLQNETVYITDKTFEDKADDYIRLDFGIKYRKNLKKSAWIFSIDIQNLTNRENIAAMYYDTYSQKIENVYLVGMIPIFNIRCDF